jgi:hypothetical protein
MDATAVAAGALKFAKNTRPDLVPTKIVEGVIAMDVTSSGKRRLSVWFKVSPEEPESSSEDVCQTTTFPSESPAAMMPAAVFWAIAVTDA